MSAITTTPMVAAAKNAHTSGMLFFWTSAAAVF